MILEVDQIQCFYGLSQALHGVSLKVAAGEIVSLLGRNGAGKTTLITSIVGLIPPRSGTIRLAGTPISGHPPHHICSRGVGWVPQGRRIFPHLSVEENLRLATLKLGREFRRDALERAHGLFPILATRGGAAAGVLSGGEQQMLAVARALIGNPNVLLLDEPTEGLSPLMVQSLMKTIREVAAQGVAVLLAEQNVRMALITASRHYILDKGEIRTAMTTAEIESRQDLLVAYLGVGARSGVPAVDAGEPVVFVSTIAHPNSNS